ncbi:MAG: group II intron reverse transcriptase domain-containing protein [Eubacteriaceae bacterium]|nr:group II intron reverse transcriptase domain-containing protein [Eubacteriaceae bacterium]
MGIIDDVRSEELWRAFLCDREQKVSFPKRFRQQLEKIIDEKLYLSFYEEIVSGSFHERIPVKKLVAKTGKAEKRTVYYYPGLTGCLLKFINWRLAEYSYLFGKDLYSFSGERNSKSALSRLLRIKDLRDSYIYKLDISSYFNSIDQSILIPELEEEIPDRALTDFLQRILTKHRFIFEGTVIEEDPGAMPGLPFAGFFANFYLRGMDSFFSEKGYRYFRYADDIMVLCSDMDDYRYVKENMEDMLERRHLRVNRAKERLYLPGESFEFLGFGFDPPKVDLSQVAFRKIKARIRRQARSIRRWMLRKDVETPAALSVMIRKFDRKFFGTQPGEICWAAWYFPWITTDATLRQVDRYLQQEIRYIATGRHSNMNYRAVSYDEMKRLGYRSLVNEYYKYIEMSKNEDCIHKSGEA